MTTILQILSICLVISRVATLHISNQKKITIPLIHKIPTSYHSYNSNISYDSTFSSDGDGDAAVSPLYPNQANTIFLASVSMGNPPARLHLAMDTGSPLTWVCKKCYDPEFSSTFNRLPCSASPSFCSELYPRSYCNLPVDNQCSFVIEYGVSTMLKVTGLFAMETLTFLTSDYDGTIQLKNFLFGIGNYSTHDLSGILALGYENNNSLISRFPNRTFSYCLGNISDPNYEFSGLVLGGDDAILQGFPTPMFYTDGHYSVQLDTILVGDRVLDIEKEELSNKFVIDSGTTHTLLRRKVFDRLKEEVGNVMKSLKMETIVVRGQGEIPCYRGDLARDLKEFPMVTLRFRNGVEMNLGTEGMFRRHDGYSFCMAVDVAGNINIVGAYAQQHHNIGFDLNKELISFERINCRFLEN